MSNRVVPCPACGAKNRVPAVAAGGHPRCPKCRADLPWLVDAGDVDFDQVADTRLLVLVDLWAPWCGPCRMVAPILDKLSGEFAGRLKVVKVNVDENPRLAQRFAAQSIPLLVLLKGGSIIDTVIGAQPESTLRRTITAHL